MFGIGGFELFLIILFAFLVFGPDKLPEIANVVGKAIAKFRNAKDEMTGSLNAKSFLSDDPDQPIKNPIEVLEQAAATVEAKRNKVDKAVAGGAAGTAFGTAGNAAGASSKAAAQTVRPGSAVENYPAFAERKAAYEREQAAKAGGAAGSESKAEGESALADKSAPAPANPVADPSEEAE